MVSPRWGSSGLCCRLSKKRLRWDKGSGSTRSGVCWVPGAGAAPRGGPWGVQTCLPMSHPSDVHQLSTPIAAPSPLLRLCWGAGVPPVPLMGLCHSSSFLLGAARDSQCPTGEVTGGDGHSPCAVPRAEPSHPAAPADPMGCVDRRSQQSMWGSSTAQSVGLQECRGAPALAGSLRAALGAQSPLCLPRQTQGAWFLTPPVG